MIYKMERKYFAFKKDYIVGYPTLKEKITIPAHQPILVERLLDEYGYCFLIKHITCETSYSLGYFKDEITKDEEIEMWKLLAKYAESSLSGWLDSDLRKQMEQGKQIQEMWRKQNRQEEIIEALRKSLSYFEERGKIFKT